MGNSEQLNRKQLIEGIAHRDAHIYELEQKLREIAKELESADEIPGYQIDNESYSKEQVAKQNTGLINIYEIVLEYT